MATGLSALQRGRAGPVGLVSELPPFAALDLAAPASLVIGGHDIRAGHLVEEARQFARTSRAFEPGLVDQVADDLNRIDHRARPGILAHGGKAIAALADENGVLADGLARDKIARVQADLRDFQTANELDRIVVVNLASTEPPFDSGSLPETWSALEPLLDEPDCRLPSSSLYAIATLDLGHAFVNFTPSPGSTPAALDQLAIQRGAVHAGRDGKTGETLIKSALAPVFAMRHLNVMSWVGHNIFGNLDGRILDDPANKQTKVASKDRMLGEILGYQPQSHISIEYIRSLGDWKTAWDHIHFEGFLGTPMTLQFTWQGCDSMLAAPLVLDLARFAERALRAGQSGVLSWLSCFFKSPAGTGEHNPTRQFGQLLEWAGQLPESAAGGATEPSDSN